MRVDLGAIVRRHAITIAILASIGFQASRRRARVRFVETIRLLQ